MKMQKSIQNLIKIKKQNLNKNINKIRQNLIKYSIKIKLTKYQKRKNNLIKIKLTKKQKI